MKPYQLTIHPMPGYLHVIATGENSVQSVTSYINEVGVLCEQQKYSVVLIEENLQGPGLNMFDIFKVMRQLKSSPKILQWIVYVDANPAHDPGMMDFARELAIKRGLRVRLCRTTAEAKDWIETWVK